MLTCHRSDGNRAWLLGRRSLLCVQTTMCDESWLLESGRCDFAFCQQWSIEACFAKTMQQHMGSVQNVTKYNCYWPFWTDLGASSVSNQLSKDWGGAVEGEARLFAV